MWVNRKAHHSLNGCSLQTLMLLNSISWGFLQTDLRVSFWQGEAQGNLTFATGQGWRNPAHLLQSVISIHTHAADASWSACAKIRSVEGFFIAVVRSMWRFSCQSCGFFRVRPEFEQNFNMKTNSSVNWSSWRGRGHLYSGHCRLWKTHPYTTSSSESFNIDSAGLSLKWDSERCKKTAHKSHGFFL